LIEQQSSLGLFVDPSKQSSLAPLEAHPRERGFSFRLQIAGNSNGKLVVHCNDRTITTQPDLGRLDFGIFPLDAWGVYLSAVVIVTGWWPAKWRVPWSQVGSVIETKDGTG
jgi:hypothetical protein